jgi:hypothetical protein
MAVPVPEHQTIKVYCEVTVYLHASLASALNGGEW